MAFFDDLKVKAAELTQVGVAKSKQLAEIARLNLANSSEEDSIRKAYLEIGKLYYAERGMAPEAAYTALCEKITAAKINIEENKARIAALKTEENEREAEVPVMETVVPSEEPAVELDIPAEEPPAAPAEPVIPAEPSDEAQPE